jgi:predicted DsbA family dithiol-disulfide isomerase
LEELKETHEFDLHWRSFELRPAGAPPPAPDYIASVMQRRPLFVNHMWETFGITIEAGEFGINSRKSLIGAKIAEAQSDDIGAAYHKNALSAYWTEAADISQADVLKDIAARSGMDGDAFVAALDDPQYDEQVTNDLMMAYQFGFNSVPSLLFENKYYIAGAQPIDVLRQIIDKIQAGEINQ